MSPQPPCSPVLRPGVPGKGRVSPGAAARVLCRWPPARPAAARLLAAGVRTRGIAENHASGREGIKKGCPPLPIPPRKGPSCRAVYLITASLERSRQGGSRARAGARGESAGGGGQPLPLPLPCPPLPLPCPPLPLPLPCPPLPPRGARTPAPVPGSCRCCEKRPRSKWMPGKVCLKLPRI